ncbi:AAA family ATPase [Paenibacillus chartarius]|uniref:AAA family ATPase n=1 Tax=Paenibacillus chartarius TaxID=747481 RepID=A0ABV6DLY1_9BACL
MVKGLKYEVKELLCNSGSKLVCLCRDTETGQPFIAKALRADAASYEEIMRFKQEYRILVELSPKVSGVVKPVKLEEQSGYLVMVLENIPGQTLKDWLTESVREQETLLKLALQIVDIVGGIHEQRVIHKDLKPSNMIVNLQTGEIKIIDFDMSVKLAKEKTEFQNSGLLQGTLPYISPEQTGRMNRSIDYRSDYYSLGVMFYEMFTGVRPHGSGSIMDQVYAIIAKRPVPPHELTRGNVPKPLSDVIMKLLEKSPEDRYRSAFGLKADLRRCLQREEEGFVPGREDRLDVFQLSQKLYGREKELRELGEAFESCLRERSQLMLVSGEAGIGKTALVGELHSLVSRSRGFFIQGKFDQYNRHIPYSAMIYAFRTLLSQLKSGEAAQVELLRQSLSERLGENGGLLVGLLPELESLIGTQPPSEPLNPTEETNRFFLSLLQFIEALTYNEKPLVLFLDDMQWADMSSIQLLERLVGSTSLRRLLVVASFRHNELSDGHPLMEAVEQIAKEQEVKRIHLLPLTDEDVGKLLEDTLGAAANSASGRKLCRIVCSTTKGNPFFVGELLKDLHKQGVVYFDPTRGTWVIRQERLGGLTLSNDIVEYLIAQTNRLPEHVRTVLSLSAMIGQQFDWALLSLISGMDTKTLTAALVHAVDEDVIVPLNGNYRVLGTIAEEYGLSLDSLEIPFSFRHDKIQQALYQTIDVETRKRLHLKIGRLMLEQLSLKETEEKLIDIAGHLNKGLDYAAGADELETIVDVNLRAAKRAKDAFGYDTSFQLLEVAIGLLPDGAWSAQYERTFEIFKLYSECAYLTHRLQTAEDACRELIRFARTPMETALVYEMQANHYTYLGMMSESIAAGKLGLKALGLNVPNKVGMGKVLRELIRVKLALRGKTAEQLLAGPTISDRQVRLMMKLLVSFIPPAFISGETNLFGWVVLRKTYLSATYGNAPESAGAYVGFAILLSGLGDLKGAKRYGDLAVQLNEKFNDIQWRSLVSVLYTLFSYSWSAPWDTLEAKYKKAIESSLKSGDLLYLAHACYYMNLWNPSMEIERYLQDSVRTIAMIQNTKYKEALATARLARQKFLSLAGELSDPLSFDDASFSEADYLRQLTEAKYYSGIAIYYVSKVQILYTFGKYREALAYLEEADKHIGTLAGSAFMEEFSLYSFLSLAACYPGMKWSEKPGARLRMRKELGRMKKWAAHFPDNFLL